MGNILQVQLCKRIKHIKNGRTAPTQYLPFLYSIYINKNLSHYNLDLIYLNEHIGRNIGLALLH